MGKTLFSYKIVIRKSPSIFCPPFYINLCNCEHCSKLKLTTFVQGSQACPWYVLPCFGIGCCDVEIGGISLLYSALFSICFCYCWLSTLNYCEITLLVLKKWSVVEKSCDVVLCVLATGSERSLQRSESEPCFCFSSEVSNFCHFLTPQYMSSFSYFCKCRRGQ